MKDETSQVSLQKKASFWFHAIWVSVILVLVPPILGLPGTVTGMVGAFQTLEGFVVADPEVLAEDISLAVVTTAGGLVLSLIAFVFFIVALVRYLTLSKRLRLEQPE